MSLRSRFRSLWSGLRSRRFVEQDMIDEFAAHVELRAADLVRQGMTPDEAMRLARLEFGSPEQFRDEGRAARGLRHVDEIRFSWLDFKLGFRMLAKYPVLTLVAGFALSFAIWVGAGAFEVVYQVVNPTVPLPDGERLVTLRNWDVAANNDDPRALRDFADWKKQLKTVEEVGAWRRVDRNLVLADGRAEPVRHVEMSASGFRLARTPALLGRTLIESDEAPDAPDVLVIGHDVWQARFGADSGVIGRRVRLGGTAVEIVGVMPEGFAFPVAHNAWRPFRMDPLDHARREGPPISVFARLVEGSRLKDARLEIALLGQRIAIESPETHEHLRPQVVPYAQSDLPTLASLALLSSNLLLVLLVLLVSANVALLMFARAATREGEIVIRSALGASRRRVVIQLFSEALVLGALAAAAGLAAASAGIRWGLRMVQGELGDLPFWFDSTLSAPTLAYTVVLTLLVAAMTGILPAMKVTRDLAGRLKEASAGGGGVRFGGIWTVIIVAQVAVTVVFPSVAFFVGRDVVKIEEYDLGLDPTEFVTFGLQMDRVEADSSNDAFLARFSRASATLEERLMALPGVRGVTVANRVPRLYHGWNQVEVDGGVVPQDSSRGHRVSSANVDLDYFDVLGTPLLAGRVFHSGDRDADSRSVIVNQPFVDMVFGGRNAIGRRIRYVAREPYNGVDVVLRAQPSLNRLPSPDGPWYDVVGVARDLGTVSGYGRAGIYHPIARGLQYPVSFFVRTAGRPDAMIAEIRSVAATVDPTFRVYRPMTLEDVVNDDLDFYNFWLTLLRAVSAMALLLSLAGIYAVTSYAVSRRTREIGVRVALGASPLQIITAILRRPLLQVCVGIVIGTILTGGLSGAIGIDAVRQRGAVSMLVSVGVVMLYGVVMLGVCLLACIVPTRRALSIQPTDALRAD
ncbi:MAG TPA: FtsX-like permease family protein [Gemmatimonadaceae bacterium]